MPKEVYVAPARWKNFKMKPVRVFDITGDYDNVRHVFPQEFSDVDSISQQFTYCQTISHT